jgi:co-chaperonin GroES (HSP10)
VGIAIPTEAKTQLNPGAVVAIGSRLGRSRAFIKILKKPLQILFTVLKLASSK